MKHLAELRALCDGLRSYVEIDGATDGEAILAAEAKAADGGGECDHELIAVYRPIYSPPRRP